MLYFTAWITTVAALITIASQLEKWITNERNTLLSRFVNKRLLTTHYSWMHEVSFGFLSVFDKIYIKKKTKISYSIWIGIFLTYVIFPLSHIVLYISSLPTPSTELILGAVLVVSTVGILLTASILYGIDFTKNNSSLNSKHNLFYTLTFGIGSVFIAISGIALIVHGMGTSISLILSLAFGGSLVLPILLLVSQIPSKLYPISPLKSFASSIFWMLVFCFAFPDVALTITKDPDIQRVMSGQLNSITEDLLNAIKNNNASWLGPVLFLIYNLIADMISLAETRLILKISLNKKGIHVFFLLAADIIISGLIYIALPVIAGQDLYHLWQAVFFEGPTPYLGILFWSTFTTSAVFYIFVASSWILYILSPFLNYLNSASIFFGFLNHPIRAITGGMIILITIIFLAAAPFSA